MASHHSAALLWGLDLLIPPETVSVCVPRNRSRIAMPDAQIYRRDVPLSETAVLERWAVRVTGLPRTVVDLLGVLDFPEAVVVTASVLRRGDVPVEAIVDVARRHRRISRLLPVLAVADRHSGSALEALQYVRFVEAGMAPVLQFEVRVKRRLVARVDFAWPEYGVVVEVDGFDYHRERADYLSDRRKSNELTRLGYVLLRYGWEDVVLRPDHVIAEVRGMLSARGWTGNPASS